MMRRLSLLSLLLATAACDTMAPVPEGKYVLVSQGGVAMPGIVYADSNARYTTLADTVEIRRDGKGRRVNVTRYDWLQGTPETFSWSSQRDLELFESGNRWRVREHIYCIHDGFDLDVDVTEYCSSLWDQEVAVDGIYLQLATRRYRRISAPITSGIPWQ